MQVLSIRQPYAWMILEGIKDTEYRSWNTKHRGPLLIHASKTVDTKTMAKVRKAHVDNRQLLLGMYKGGIVGVVNLDDVMYRKGGYEWKLSRPRKLDFFTFPGKPGLFQFDGRLVGLKTE